MTESMFGKAHCFQMLVCRDDVLLNLRQCFDVGQRDLFGSSLQQTNPSPRRVRDSVCRGDWCYTGYSVCALIINQFINLVERKERISLTNLCIGGSSLY